MNEHLVALIQIQLIIQILLFIGYITEKSRLRQAEKNIDILMRAAGYRPVMDPMDY